MIGAEAHIGRLARPAAARFANEFTPRQRSARPDAAPVDRPDLIHGLTSRTRIREPHLPGSAAPAFIDIAGPAKQLGRDLATERL